MSAPYELHDDSVVVVIGSGAGGGTLANELAQKGIDVLCLEAGGRLELSDIANDPPALLANSFSPWGVEMSSLLENYDHIAFAFVCGEDLGSRRHLQTNGNISSCHNMGVARMSANSEDGVTNRWAHESQRVAKPEG